MKANRRSRPGIVAGLYLALISLAIAPALVAQTVFTDDFASGASTNWSNTRGNWVAANGNYSAQQPSNNPLTFSGLPFLLKDFILSVDIYDIADGGIWLRCSPDGQNGVLLITGGNGWGSGTRGGAAGRSFYWHTLQNGGASSKQNEVFDVITDPGVQDMHLDIQVLGNVYAVYVNHSNQPAAMLTNSLFATGGVGLYDFSEQTFDNVALTAICPEISIERLSPDQVQLCWLSATGRTYLVESTTNLSPAAWSPLLTNVATAGDQTCITNNVTVASPHRFYRVVCQ